MAELPVHQAIPAGQYYALVCSHDGEPWPCGVVQRSVPVIEIRSGAEEVHTDG